jgi:hypothetical protein
VEDQPIKPIEFLYPGAGDLAPTKGEKGFILTKGGIPLAGPWDESFCIGWHPFPSRNRDKEESINALMKKPS